jgi:hypothetical protein
MDLMFYSACMVSRYIEKMGIGGKLKLGLYLPPKSAHTVSDTILPYIITTISGCLAMIMLMVLNRLRAISSVVSGMNMTISTNHL